MNLNNTKTPLGVSAASTVKNLEPAHPGIRQHRYHETDHGDFASVLIGTQVWFHGGDVSRHTHLETEAITRIAGKSRTVAIPNRWLSNPDIAQGTEIYVLSDVVIGLLKTMEHTIYVAETLERWIASDLLSASHQMASGAYVHASTLHKVLGSHLAYDFWVQNTDWKIRGLFSAFDEFDDFNDDECKGPKTVLTKALEIARREGGFAGELTAILIRDGGYFHNGQINESADATLLRFRGLMPDHSGRVVARKVHEFVGDPDSFEEWMRDTQRRYVFASGHDELISINEAYYCGLGEFLTCDL